MSKEENEDDGSAQKIVNNFIIPFTKQANTFRKQMNQFVLDNDFDLSNLTFKEPSIRVMDQPAAPHDDEEETPGQNIPLAEVPDVPMSRTPSLRGGLTTELSRTYVKRVKKKQRPHSPRADKATIF